MSTGVGVGIGIGPFGTKAPEGVAWTPAELFSGGADGAWYDPSDSSTVFQDAAGTTPAGNGDPVGLIHDKSGNGNHASQSDANFKPTLVQSGSLWYLDFGDDDYLESAGLGVFHNLDSDMTVAHAIVANDTTGMLFQRSGAGGSWYMLYTSGSTNVTYSDDAVVTSVQKDGVAATVANRGDAYTLYSSLAVQSFHCNTAGWVDGQFRVGFYSGIGAEFDAYGMVWVEGTVTGTDRSSLESWLATKAGV